MFEDSVRRASLADYALEREIKVEKAGVEDLRYHHDYEGDRPHTLANRKGFWVVRNKGR